jgi:hypothetical protein
MRMKMLSLFRNLSKGVLGKEEWGWGGRKALLIGAARQKLHLKRLRCKKGRAGWVLLWKGGGGRGGKAKLFKSGGWRGILVWERVKGGRGDKVGMGVEMCL